MTKLLDYLDVPVLHFIAIAITFTDIENALKLFSLLLASIHSDLIHLLLSKTFYRLWKTI